MIIEEGFVVSTFQKQLDKLTPDEYAQIIQKTKPYLIAIEELVQDVKFGDIDLKLSVKGGMVEKMQLIVTANWIREKEAVGNNSGFSNMVKHIDSSEKDNTL